MRKSEKLRRRESGGVRGRSGGGMRRKSLEELGGGSEGGLNRGERVRCILEGVGIVVVLAWFLSVGLGCAVFGSGFLSVSEGKGEDFAEEEAEGDGESV